MLYQLYLDDFLKGVICDTSKLFYIHGIDFDNRWLECFNSKNLKETKVVFNNVIFNSEILNCVSIHKRHQLEFICKEVLFDNCELKNIRMSFGNSNRLQAMKCTFSDYTDTIFSFYENFGDVILNECKFRNCQTRFAAQGVVITVNENVNGNCLNIENCIFDNLCLGNNETRDSIAMYGGIVFYIDKGANLSALKVNDAIFKNCKHLGRDSYGRGIKFFNGLPSRFKNENCCTNCQIVHSLTDIDLI